jgi:hypothetical protein
MVSGPVVDTASALEFQREITNRITESELGAIAGELSVKSATLRELLGDDPAGLDRARLRQVLRCVFATRRRADAVLDLVGTRPLAAAVGELLGSSEAVADRIDRFDVALRELGTEPRLAGCRFDLPFELLHFTEPDRYWLWTRWIFEPQARTGALALLTTEDVDLGAGATKGAVYLSVGRAMAFVDETGKAAGFTAAGPGLFGVDVLLAAVYGIYMYTVFQMRMTREFTRVIPPLADLVRRLLGVYHLEV